MKVTMSVARRVPRAREERGIALITALMIMMLTSSLLVGFTMLVVSDNRARLVDEQRTVAFYAAHAGLEKLTADLGDLFTKNYSPSGTTVNALTEELPSLGGPTFNDVNDESGYTVVFTDTNADGNPDTVTRQVASGPFQGFTALVTDYTVSTTAQSGAGEVRLERTLQTVAIPVFQFGIFSENDLSFHPGPAFDFGGRVHTNGNLFLAAVSGLQLADRVTAVGEIVRTHMANGWANAGSSYAGPVNVARAPNVYRNLALTEGSLTGTLGSSLNSAWTTISMTTYSGYIRNGRTGVQSLNLPLVQDGAVPIDIIRRPNPNAPDPPQVADQRYFNMGTLRILLGDQPTELMAPYTATNTQPISLESFAAAQAAGYTGEPFATSSGVVADGYQTTAGTSLLGGFIKIERQDTSENWTDVTREILNLGIAGKKLVQPGTAAPTKPFPTAGGSPGPRLEVPSDPTAGNACADPNSPAANAVNAVIRLQRVRDYYTTAAAAPLGTCGLDAAGRGPTVSTNYVPNVLYDAREAVAREGESTTQYFVYLGGVMHYVELDVNNLRRWLTGAIGASGPGSMNVTGYVVYFSDRRGNRNFGADTVPFNADDLETGELGWEDFVNRETANSAPNGVLNPGEDLNGNGTLETYGNTARSPAQALPGVVVGGTNIAAASLPANEDANNDGNRDNGENDTNANGYLDNGVALFDRPGIPVTLRTRVPYYVARVNRPVFFRRALKLVNGGRGQLPANGSQGLTVVSENPVYVQGNYNACGTSLANCATNGFGATGDGHVSASIIADAVTLLSKNFNDLSTFLRPHQASGTYPSGQGHPLQGLSVKPAEETWWRFAVVSGKSLAFQRPTNNAADPENTGTDGGTHNFLRFLENWTNVTANYRGSMVSFYENRQANGIFKCCVAVYTPPSREYGFDVEFLLPTLLPPRTPMFRDVNATGFTQRTNPCEQSGRPDCGTP